MHFCFLFCVCGIDVVTNDPWRFIVISLVGANYFTVMLLQLSFSFALKILEFHVLDKKENHNYDSAPLHVYPLRWYALVISFVKLPLHFHFFISCIFVDEVTGKVLIFQLQSKVNELSILETRRTKQTLQCSRSNFQ